MSKEQDALKLALEALTHLQPTALTSFYTIGDRDKAITAIREALAEQPAQRCPLCNHQHGHAIGCKNNPVDIALAKMAEQPAQQQEQKLEFVSPGGGYVPAIPRPLPLDWKLVPRKATPEMLKAMDECAKEGYDERLYAGMASSVYMAAWDASPVMGTLPEQPAQQQEPVAIDRLYIEALIEGLYQNEDPVSIDAAEEFERLLKTPASPPPRKPWVGLTAGEIYRAIDEAKHCPTDLDIAIAEIIEAKLKDKNGY